MLTTGGMDTDYDRKGRIQGTGLEEEDRQGGSLGYPLCRKEWLFDSQVA